MVHGDGAHNKNCIMFKKFIPITNPDRPCSNQNCERECLPLDYDERDMRFWE